MIGRRIYSIAAIGTRSPLPSGGPSPGVDNVPPTAPSGLIEASVTQNSFLLSWTASQDAVGVLGYRVYRDGILVSGASLVTGTTFVVSGLAPATSYVMTVIAVDTAGNPSVTSPARSVTTAAAQVATVTAQVVASDRIQLTFNLPLGFTTRRSAYHMWTGYYGFNIVASGRRRLAIRDIFSLPGDNTLDITIAGKLLPDDVVTIAFTPQAESPTYQAGGAIPNFNITATNSLASLTGTIRYAAPGTTSGTGSAGSPWTLAQLNTQTLAAGTTVRLVAGTYTGQLIPRSGIRYYVLGTGYAVIDGTGTSAAIWADSPGVQDVEFVGIEGRNRNDAYGFQGFRFRISNNIRIYNCQSTSATNGIYSDGTSNITVSGCYLANCYNAGFFADGWPSGPEPTNIQVLFCEVHNIAENDGIVVHADADSSAGSTGTVGANVRFQGNHVWDIKKEENFDCTTGGEQTGSLVVMDNYAHDSAGAFLAIGWTAQFLEVSGNYFKSDIPGEKVPWQFLYCRVNDVKIWNNVFEGPTIGPSGNGRGHIVLLGSDQNPQENAERIDIQHNVFVLHTNGRTAANSTPLALQFLTLVGRPVPSDFVKFERNLVVIPADKSYPNGVVEFSDTGLFNYTSPVYQAAQNYYVLSGPSVYELNNTQTALSVIQAGGKESGSVSTTSQPVFVAGRRGPERFIPVAGTPLAIATNSPTFAQTDFSGQARTGTVAVGAFNAL